MIGAVWRQHRGQALLAVIAVLALCLLTFIYGLSAEHWMTGYSRWLGQLSAAGCPPPDAHSGVFHVRSAATCSALKDRYPGGLQPSFGDRFHAAILLSQYGLTIAFALIGSLIGAPLVAREIEQRSHLAAWTQSVSRRRWYVTKTVALASGLMVLGLVAGLANGWLQRRLVSGDITSSRWSWFSSIDLALAGEALLAFALGVALGAFLRRTLPALGASLAVFTLLLLGARWAVLALTPTSSGSASTAPPGSWILDPGTASAVAYHPASQYAALQTVLLLVLIVVAGAVLLSGWRATRDGAV